MSAPVDRLCWFCKHFSFSLGDSGSPGYSSWTPGWAGTAGSMTCAANVWVIDTGSTQAQLNAALVRARTCDLFEPTDEAVALFNAQVEP